jgi:hypothetical protein
MAGGDGGALLGALVSFFRLARLDEDVDEGTASATATATAGPAATVGAIVVTGGVDDAVAAVVTGAVAATAARSIFLAAFLSARVKGTDGGAVVGNAATADDADTAGTLPVRCFVFLVDDAPNAATAAACDDALAGV